MLLVDKLCVHLDGIRVLRDVALEVGKGEIVTLIGANGAGKSTLLRAITGLVRVAAGEIRFEEHLLSGRAPHEIVPLGIGHVPEGRRIFANLTVWENLDLGAWGRRSREEIESNRAWVLKIFPRLKERPRQIAGTLSGGEQQMLAIGRALMGSPRLLLLDEPSLGLAPTLVREIFSILMELNQRGVTILLVEQNAHMALRIAHRGYVLETGQIVLEGEASALAVNPRVKEAYLGE